MTFWIWFWTIFLLASLALFAVLVVVVSIGGFFDIKRMFARLKEQHDRS